MTEPTYTRTILAVGGADATAFLQGITTQDMLALRPDALCLTAFLSPQGKLLHDAFAWRDETTIYLDTDAASADALLAFLTRYKLRAKITLGKSDLALTLTDNEGMPDPRHADMPHRLYTTHNAPPTTHNYHPQRIALGIPEAASDSKGDDVAMDMGYDALGAISFTKGCYVGQEVTARMHYKQIARKSILHVAATQPLPASFSPIACGALTLGALRSREGTHGLALIRLDTWEDAIRSAQPITCEHIPIQLAWPEWAAAKREQWRQGKLAHAT